MGDSKEAVEEIVPINFRMIEGTNLYRSSEPNDSHIEALKSRNVRTIVDLRHKTDVKDDTALSQHYTIYNQPLGRNMVDVNNTDCQHVIIPFLVAKDLIFRTSAPWTKKLGAVLRYCYDSVSRNDMKRTKRYVAKNIMCRDGEKSLQWLYKFIFDNSGSQVCTALRLLSRPERVPAVVCCSLGKDRTGVLCALIGHVCGRTRDQLIEDYATSQEHYDRELNTVLLEEVERLGLHPIYRKAPRDVMAEALDYVVEKHGSMDAYLDGIGFGKVERKNLQQNIQLTSCK